MDDRHYVESAVPEPFTILGLRLRPLSIGHLILLTRLESPFVVGVAPAVSVGDLALACLICSKTYMEGVDLLDRADLPKLLFRWGLVATRQHGWRSWCPWLYKPIDLEAKMVLFTDYLKYHMDLPCYSVEDGKAKGINAPGWHVVKVALMSKTTLREQEILDRPYRLCMVDFLTLRAIDGQVNFEDQGALEEAQKLANELAAKIRERNGHGVVD